MNRPGEQLLAGAARAFDQHAAAAGGNLGQQIEQAHHGRAAADDVLEGVAAQELLLQLLDLAEILKRLHSADDPAGVVFQNGGGDADGHAPALLVDDVGGGVDHRLAGLERFSQGAVLFADVGMKHVATGFAESVLARDPRDPLGRPVERGDAPLRIHREHALIDRIQNDVLSAPLDSLAHRVHPFHTSCNRAACIGTTGL